MLKSNVRTLDAEWFFVMANGHLTVGNNVYHKLKNPLAQSKIYHSWKDVRTVGDNKLLAENLQMAKTFRLRFEAYFRQDDNLDWRTVFHGTDGGSFGQHRCGGRLPGIWMRHGALPIRHAFETHMIWTISLVLETNYN